MIQSNEGNIEFWQEEKRKCEDLLSLMGKMVDNEGKRLDIQKAEVDNEGKRMAAKNRRSLLGPSSNPKRFKATFSLVAEDFDKDQFITLNDPWRDSKADTSFKNVFNRACYGPILSRLMKHIKGEVVDGIGPRAIVTGTPGVGKTVLGLLFVRELLRKDYAVLHFFQGVNDITLLVAKNGDTVRNISMDGLTPIAVDGVEEYGAYSLSEDALQRLKTTSPKVVMVVDPGSRFDHYAVEIPVVVFTSPSLDRYFEIINPGGDYIMLYVTPVPLEELKLMGSKRGVAEDVVEERFYKVGGVARVCFDEGLFNIYVAKMNEVISQITSVHDLGEILIQHGGEILPKTPRNVNSPKPSGKLVHMVCDDVDDPKTMRTVIASEAIKKDLKDWRVRTFGNDVATFRGLVSSSSSSRLAVVNGAFHEVDAHLKLVGGAEFMIRKACQNNENGEKVRVGEFELVHKKIRAGNLDQFMEVGKYYQPVAKNFASMDSFTLLASESALFKYLFPDSDADVGLCCFQMFFSSNASGQHPIYKGGIRMVVNAFHKVKRGPVAFVFVVSTLLFESEEFKEQKYKGGGLKPEGVSQFVLESDY